MDTINYYLCIPLGYLMKGCWMLVSNYGLAILLFTLATKIVLMPLSVWIQKNSILMVKIQPQINFLKAEFSGNLDAIAERQAKLFKKEHYHPMLSIIPLILQIIILLSVVYIIYHPMSYLFGISGDTIDLLAKYIGADTGSSSYQLEIIEAIKNGTITASTQIEGISPDSMASIVKAVGNFKMNFLGLNLSNVPTDVWGWYVLVPILAGGSSWVMCFTQNISNVLQHEQSKLNKYGIMTVSVLLSLYLGLFVPVGIAMYWIASNLLSIAQMYILNAVINPKKYVDYKALEESRVALANSKEFGKIDKKEPLYKEMRKREKQDYKKIQHIANKHLVFYSEKSGFYKYYKDLIGELLQKSNVVIHYVTNDYNDIIFEIANTEPRIKPYYIGLKKLTLLMMLIETDMFVMTTPDLDKYYLKRSFMKSDIEYVYAPHDTLSVHAGFKEGAFDAFDTVLCAGPHIVKELRKIEEVYKLKPKNLVEFGFPFLDELVNKVKSENISTSQNEKKEILIAPSWGEDNIMDSCLDGIIESLKDSSYHITVRPHPEYVKRYGFRMNKILERYADRDESHLSFELDFSTNKSIYSSDILITDWSGITLEFCFATERPAIFVNTKFKALNSNWEKIGLTPVEQDIRNKLGKAVEKEEVLNINLVVEELFTKANEYKKNINEYYKNLIFNHDTAAKKGAEYILKSLAAKNKK
ncbi:MAG: membrane protein insertase YidC [Clostridiales bacterium]|nr:membrane protein insertase YidC [Clostridiales bacterium]